jgi:hypothetical protein
MGMKSGLGPAGRSAEAGPAGIGAGLSSPGFGIIFPVRLRQWILIDHFLQMCPNPGKIRRDGFLDGSKAAYIELPRRTRKQFKDRTSAGKEVGQRAIHGIIIDNVALEINLF